MPLPIPAAAYRPLLAQAATRPFPPHAARRPPTPPRTSHRTPPSRPTAQPFTEELLEARLGPMEEDRVLAPLERLRSAEMGAHRGCRQRPSAIPEVQHRELSAATSSTPMHTPTQELEAQCRSPQEYVTAILDSWTPSASAPFTNLSMLLAMREALKVYLCHPNLLCSADNFFKGSRASSVYIKIANHDFRRGSSCSSLLSQLNCSKFGVYRNQSLVRAILVGL
ncbi:hypothetical protein U9M48_003388 [Paspalum notatum var. saurae]|uniref:Uncharacterized protein n=1 Tax=Paspalum notatum var. saurae TaxID=547442 RepID=A0AAQ3PHB4_PASNO